MIFIFLARIPQIVIYLDVYPLQPIKLVFTIDDGGRMIFLKNTVKVLILGSVYLLSECLTAELLPCLDLSIAITLPLLKFL